MRVVVTGAASGIGRATCLRLACDAQAARRPVSIAAVDVVAPAIMLVKVLAQEFGRDGIRVNSVSPGMVRTGMTAKVYEDAGLAAERAGLVPIGRVAAPEDIADVIAFLLGPDARYVNGHDLV